MKKIIYTMIFLFAFMISALNANAATNARITWTGLGGYYHALNSGGAYTKYGQMVKYSVNGGDYSGSVAYCIAPAETQSQSTSYTGYIYSEADLLNKINSTQKRNENKLTKEDINKISLYAYYGYSYNGHNSNEYYLATQMLIYRVMENQVFTNRLCQNGNCSKINDPSGISKAMKEIEDLVEKHFTTVSFAREKVEFENGVTKTLTDNNGVLQDFKIDSCTNCTAKINGNNLEITPSGDEGVKVTLKKGTNAYNHDLLFYTSSNSQNMVAAGNIDPLTVIIGGESIDGGEDEPEEGYISLYKEDSETGSTTQGDAVFNGAKYGIYDDGGDLVQTLKTSTSGYARSGALPFGDYTVKEISPSEGYNLDTKTYNVTIDESEETIRVNSKEPVIKFDFYLVKVKGDGSSGVVQAEPNTKFKITLISSEKEAGTITTDQDGKAKITLPYGKYSVCQITGHEDTEDALCFEIDIKDSDVRRVVNNEILYARIKIVKVDMDTNAVVPISGIKFKIKDLSTNEYVCQTASYPSNRKICEYETNEDGLLYTPYGLVVGRYQLEEVDQRIEGYLWNTEPLVFEIKKTDAFEYDEDLGYVKEVRFANKEVKGQIIIHKFGERMVIKDNNFSYENIPLPEVEFSLYKESGELIGTVLTNSDGYAEFNDLKLGKYILKETATNEEHVLLLEENDFNLEYKDQYTAVVTEEITLQNYLKKGTLELSKVDYLTGDLLPNAEFEIYTINDELLFVGKTDSNGKLKVENLKIGKYYLKEKSAPKGFILDNKTKYYFDIKEDKDITDVKVKNKPIMGNLKITKTDSYTNEPLPNTLIEVYSETDKLVFSGRTDEKGIIFIEKLRYGRYYLLEKEAPEGYVLSEEKIYFDIIKNNETVEVDIENKPIEGTLEFTKTDISTSLPLSNTLIEIYNEKDELIFSGRTNEEGKIIIENLKYGKYYIIEKEAPEGYSINSEKMYFEIKTDGEIVKSIMSDEKIKIPVPITGANKTYYVEIGATILVLCGIVSIAYAVKKRK